MRLPTFTKLSVALSPTSEAAINRHRHLVLPTVVIGVSLLVFPIIEVGYSSVPWRFGDAIWRFGVEGIISGTIFFPLLGLLLLLAAASLLETRRASFGVFVVAIVGIVSVVALCAAFTLDVLQVKAGAAPRVYPAMKKAAISALMRDAVALGGFVACAVAARRAGRNPPLHRPDKARIMIPQTRE